jgi:hypothetical protein
MSGTASVGSDLVGRIARVLVAVCFVGGAWLAVTGRLVVAGVVFLAAHTLLAGAAVVQGQRHRGAGLSLVGLGWLALSVGLAAENGNGVGLPGPPLLAAGAALVGVGTLLTTGIVGGDTGE